MTAPTLCPFFEGRAHLGEDDPRAVAEIRACVPEHTNAELLHPVLSPVVVDHAVAVVLAAVLQRDSRFRVEEVDPRDESTSPRAELELCLRPGESTEHEEQP